MEVRLVLPPPRHHRELVSLGVGGGSRDVAEDLLDDESPFSRRARSVSAEKYCSQL